MIHIASFCIFLGSVARTARGATSPRNESGGSTIEGRGNAVEPSYRAKIGIFGNFQTAIFGLAAVNWFAGPIDPGPAKGAQPSNSIAKLSIRVTAVSPRRYFMIFRQSVSSSSNSLTDLLPANVSLTCPIANSIGMREFRESL
jgi:hypothetical protein